MALGYCTNLLSVYSGYLYDKEFSDLHVMTVVFTDQFVVQVMQLVCCVCVRTIAIE